MEERRKIHVEPRPGDSPTEKMTVVDVAATNVRGMGATQLVASLLPALEACPGVTIRTIVLPADGPLSDYRRATPGARPMRYRRFLPNAVSRVLECTVFSGRVGRSAPLLVLGDIPIRHRSGQIVLVHSPHLLPPAQSGQSEGSFKYKVSRALFRLNLRFVSCAVVQTEAMRRAMQAAYPALANRLVVISQPPPEWLLRTALKRVSRTGAGLLKLFYPAAGYPHKNHSLLEAFERGGFGDDLVEAVTVTVAPPEGRQEDGLLQYRGTLAAEDIVRCYASADALIFPSLQESYGLPLVEAMHLGLPIVCADLQYGHALCGSDAIYFDPNDPQSLRDALTELRRRLDAGWWPDWSEQLSRIPRSWNDVAARMLALVDAGSVPP